MIMQLIPAKTLKIVFNQIHQVFRFGSEIKERRACYCRSQNQGESKMTQGRGYSPELSVVIPANLLTGGIR